MIIHETESCDIRFAISKHLDFHESPNDTLATGIFRPSDRLY